MCGIAGVRRFDGRDVDPAVIRVMTALLRHRGPDDEQFVVNGRVGLGHTRLAIIDLSGSKQPMSSSDGRYTLTFNGEVFNFQDLRRQLDYPFRTQGDTEVVLATTVLQGPKAAAASFVGQFAFGMHDRETDTTWLVRDRLGILPLYYYGDESMFAFASEIKALLPVIPGGAQLDPATLRGYLKARAVHAPDTLFAGVKKVQPGHVLTVAGDGTLTSKAYWSLPEPTQVITAGPGNAVDLVERTLVSAIDSALVADVPVGAYLSGGVDSSLIVAMAVSARARKGDTGPLETFSADFGDERFSEGIYAERVSRLFSTSHHRVRVDAADFQMAWSELTWHRDAPISEPADIAVAQLAQRASARVKVVLSGEGSDELFGGYPKYRLARATSVVAMVPAALRSPVMRRAERALPSSQARLRIALRSVSGSPEVRMSDWFAPFTDYECNFLLGCKESQQVPAIPPHRDAIDLMGRVDLQTWLPDNLLERGDRMSMAAGLELRPPFLDRRMVDLAFRLPSTYKVRRGETKWVLKEVASRHLPDEIVRRPKVGFRVPLDAWFRDGLRELAHDMLTGQASHVASWMDRKTVNRILADHDSGRRNEEIRIWTLLSLEVWARRFLAVE